MEDIIQQLLQNEEILLVLIIASSISVVAIVKAFLGMITGLAHERTRREIAAYIAEGSMTPDQGQQILGSKKRNNGSCGCG